MNTVNYTCNVNKADSLTVDTGLDYNLLTSSYDMEFCIRIGRATSCTVWLDVEAVKALQAQLANALDEYHSQRERS